MRSVLAAGLAAALLAAPGSAPASTGDESADAPAPAPPAATWSAASGPERVQVVELYTSQGCSSCPAAESWLSRLIADPALWTRRVPINFHVDYWDRLGWEDPYASPLYTKRQHDWVAKLGLGSAYTPGFVVDGQEWRGFFTRGELPEPGDTKAGVLRASLEDGSVSVIWTRGAAAPDDAVAHVALLGFGLLDPIGAGENRGRELRHDFIVLGHESRRAATADGAATAQVPLPSPVADDAKRLALVAWIEREHDPEPLQATGGWLPERLVEDDEP